MAHPKPDYCRQCVGWAWGRNGFSRVTGENRVPLLFVGESSGKWEAKEGAPFVGPAGQVFEKALRTAGLERANYNLSNLLRCKPPDNELRGTSYEYAALTHCRKYLNDVVVERGPKVIVALGDLPLRELSAIHATQSEHRGFLLPSIYEGIGVLGTFHPSRILRGDWKLFGILMQDIRRAESFARRGVPPRRPTSYCYDPTDDDIRDYLSLLHSQPILPVSYDTETPELIGEKSDGRTIMLMQFSSAVGTGMVLTPDRMDAAKEIMATVNPKWGWADRTFDRALLRANGFILNGELHDLMNAHAHLQPSLMSSKDETSGEKNIPAKLMSLQSCVSLYEPWEKPWKGMVREFMAAEPDAPREALMAVVKDYAIRDVDMTLRVGQRLFASLESGGLIEGYREHKWEFSFVLDDLSTTGLPVDRQRQEKVATEIKAEDARLLRELQRLVPEELQRLHPEFGYVDVPKDIQERIDNGYDAASPPLIELSNSRGYLTQRMVTAEVINKVEVECVHCDATGSVPGVRRMKKCPKCHGNGYRWQKDGHISRDEMRWGLALFNPNSSQHILSYLEHRNYPIPLHIDTKRPTTGQKEIEALIDETDDDALRTISRIKKLTKLGGTYCGGDWIPREDGRVHGVFRFGTASGQTSCTKPNQQQWPSHFDPDDEWLVPFMQQIKGCIRAEDGHVFVKIDAKGAHSRMQAFLAEDAAYYRLSNLGTHAFVTAHYVDAPDKNRLLELDDVPLLERLKEIKKGYDWEYNFAKRCIAEGQLVLTNVGLIPIESVSVDNLVWDGVEWVTHEGVIYQGERDVITYSGLTATPDHEVYTRSQDGPNPLWLTALQQGQLVSTAIEGTPIRIHNNSLKANAKGQQRLPSGEGVLLIDQYNQVGSVATIETWKGEVFQEIWEILRRSAYDSRDEVLDGIYSLQSTTVSVLQRLWRTWNQTVVQVAEGIYGLRFGTFTPFRLQRSVNRQNQQRWSLRAWQPAISFSDGTSVEHSPHSLDHFLRQTYSHLRLQESLRLSTDRAQAGRIGADWRADNRTGMGGRTATKTMQELASTSGSTQRVRVYDILNAGTRNRFTVSGKLVSNCSFNMQYLGGAQKAAHTLRVHIAEVVTLMELIKGLFPKSFIDYPESVKRRLKQYPRLVSAHKSCRWIWDDDVQQAVAFSVANEFHCHWQSGLIRLRERGLTRRFPMVNFCHDDAWFHVKQFEADECVALCREELERPSLVLVNSLGAFQVNTEVQIGYDMQNMRDV